MWQRHVRSILLLTVNIWSHTRLEKRFKKVIQHTLYLFLCLFNPLVYLFIHFCSNNENLQIWEDLSVLMIVFYMDQYGYIKRYAKWLDRVLRVNNDVDGVTVPDTFIACMLLCTMTTNWLIDWFILMQSMRFNNSLITLSF